MFHISLPFGFCVGLVVCVAALPDPVVGESAPYVPYSGIVTGTVGADPVLLQVHNAAGAEIACTAALAHWYSEDLGRVAPGAVLDIALWHDPQTGVVALLNASRDRMPVEALFCGRADRAHETRGRIALPQTEGPAVGHLTVTCQMGAARLECRGD